MAYSPGCENREVLESSQKKMITPVIITMAIIKEFLKTEDVNKLMIEKG